MKFIVVIAASAAMCVVGTLVPAAASAAEWLANGNAITVNLASEMTGELKLEDTETPIGKIAVECKLTLAGNMGASGKNEITKILNTKGEEVVAKPGLALLGTGAGSDCKTVTGCAEGTAESPIEVWPVELPWRLSLSFVGGQFLDSFSEQWGYNLDCLVLGIPEEDKCTGPNGEITVRNNAETGDAEGVAGTQVTTGSLCLQSNLKATGVMSIVETLTMKLGSGELLTVS
jgi:hypothetical protein